MTSIKGQLAETHHRFRGLITTRNNLRRFCVLLLLLAAAPLCGSGLAWSQTADRLQTQSDINAARRAAIEDTLTAREFTRLGSRASPFQCGSLPPPEPGSVTLTAGSQVSYDSNPDPSTRTSGDWHALPDLNAAYSWQGGVAIDAALDLNSNRYLSATSQNFDEVALETKISFTTGQDCSWWNAFFYVKNLISDDFATTFAHSTNRTDQLSFGAAGSYPFRITDGRVHRSSAGDADYVVSFDINAGRQQSSSSSNNGTVANVSLSLSHYFNDDWAASLTPQLKYTFLDSSGHSWLSTNNLVVKWTPPIPNTFQRKLEIDFTESFASHHPGAGQLSYTENDAGPSFTWTWKF
jgi:hypothetical protein